MLGSLSRLEKSLDSHTTTGRDKKKAGDSATNETVTLDYIVEATEKWKKLPIIVKLWAAHFDLHDEVFKTITLWIQFPNLPLNCWPKKALSKVVEYDWIPLYCNDCLKVGHNYGKAE
ncbi:hypothetical protein RDI58_000997 [Solanum bulbocastanum]|uniref:DUF4283 domain-containing protein n=1 Tax=Solanum bulbocastanum TaxID=147425 RepID=A0AAN8U753_SOLBU